MVGGGRDRLGYVAEQIIGGAWGRGSGAMETRCGMQGKRLIAMAWRGSETVKQAGWHLFWMVGCKEETSLSWMVHGKMGFQFYMCLHVCFWWL